MVDTPDTILLVRLQGTGDNVNLWGGYLNTGLQTITRGAKGYQSLAMTGDATISWSNYSATNDGSVSFLKLTGSLSSAATLTFPNYMQNLMIWNVTGQIVTIKCSGQTGVAIPSLVRTKLFCDGTDFYSAAPNWINTVTTGNDGDVISRSAMDAAIAASFSPTFGSSGTIKITSSDTTPKYLNGAIAVAGALTKAVTTPSANETLTLTVGALGLTDGGRNTASFTASASTRYQCAWASNGTVTLPASPVQGDVIMLAVFFSAFTTTINPNGKKINGSTANLAMGSINDTLTLTHDATLGDWA